MTWLPISTCFSGRSIQSDVTHYALAITIPLPPAPSSPAPLPPPCPLAPWPLARTLSLARHPLRASAPGQRRDARHGEHAAASHSGTKMVDELWRWRASVPLLEYKPQCPGKSRFPRAWRTARSRRVFQGSSHRGALPGCGRTGPAETVPSGGIAGVDSTLKCEIRGFLRLQPHSEERIWEPNIASLDGMIARRFRG